MHLSSIFDREKRFLYTAKLFGYYPKMSDEKYLKMRWKSTFGKELNLDAPITFNEKLQWLKLYDRNPAYTNMVDKYEAKRIVSRIIGEEYIIPTIGVWNSFDAIDFSKLPNQFVLKCTHDSHGIVICKDKSKLDINKARSIINRSLKRNYFFAGREWPYKNVKPRIIAEQYMEDTETLELRDYKFFCFNGKVRALYIASDRQRDTKETKFDFYDDNYNHLPFTNGHPNSENPIKKPINFDKMIELASALSHGIPHVRVDLYEVDGRVFFGELTFFHWSGFMPFSPEEWDYTFGNWLELPKK